MTAPFADSFSLTSLSLATCAPSLCTKTSKNICTVTHLPHPRDQRTSTQPPEGVLRPCVATHFLGWGCVGCVPASHQPSMPLIEGDCIYFCVTVCVSFFPTLFLSFSHSLSFSHKISFSRTLSLSLSSSLSLPLSSLSLSAITRPRTRSAAVRHWRDLFRS